MLQQRERVATMSAAPPADGPIAPVEPGLATGDTPGVGASSAKSSSKAHRKKANRKAKKKAANAKTSALLQECEALTHADLFSSTWFRAFHQYKKVYRVYYLASSDLTADCAEWMLLLTKVNMQRLYDRVPGWGWKDEDKRAELTDPKARFFIVTAEGPSSASASAGGEEFIGEPVAFCHIRYQTGDDDGAPISYVWELQLEESLQRQGLGRFLMSLVELAAWKCQLRRVVLTVFRDNQPARRFYTQTLNYTLDDTDPELYGHDEEYQILAKRNRKLLTSEDIVLPLIPPAAATATPSTA